MSDDRDRVLAKLIDTYITDKHGRTIHVHTDQEQWSIWAGTGKNHFNWKFSNPIKKYKQYFIMAAHNTEISLTTALDIIRDNWNNRV